MPSIQESFIQAAYKNRLKSSEDFLSFKKKFFSENKMAQPTNADLREIYEKMIKKGTAKRNLILEKSMLSRAVRTQSGVAVVAVLTKPSTCPGKCIFCPTEKGMPKSYLSNEPAVMRAIMNKFNPYSQVQSRLKALELNGHPIDKIELIVMGGTFSYFPKNYQKKFIMECFQACNSYSRKYKVESIKQSITEKLLKEQRKNEKARCRIVGLTLETRPDYINEKEIVNFRNLGCTRVELGIQSVYDDILKKNNRGHGVKEIINSTKLLKDAGFKINYHMMPGLLGSSPQKDYKMFEELFSSENFQPDMLKVYPTVVVKGTELYKLWKKGQYKPLTDKVFEILVIKIKKNIIPPYTRIQRLIRDVPMPSIEAGPRISNLRQIIAEKTDCKCIRCREVKGSYASNQKSKVKSSKIILDRIDYDASEGKEIFLQYIDKENKKLLALLRLRIPSYLYYSNQNKEPRSENSKKLKDNEAKNYIFSALKNSALIREVHTYGKLVSVSEKDKKSPQHIGLGKKLILEAERIAEEEFGLEKITVISGVGVRGYYRKLGYRLKDTYMVKDL